MWESKQIKRYLFRSFLAPFFFMSLKQNGFRLLPAVSDGVLDHVPTESDNGNSSILHFESCVLHFSDHHRGACSYDVNLWFWSINIYANRLLQYFLHVSSMLVTVEQWLWLRSLIKFWFLLYLFGPWPNVHLHSTAICRSNSFLLFFRLCFHVAFTSLQRL